MARRRGLQTDILLNLSVVMATAVLVVGTALVKAHQIQSDRLRLLAATALTVDPHPIGTPLAAREASIQTWTVGPNDQVAGRAGTEPIDSHGLDIAREARRRGAALLSSATVWQPAYFAGITGPDTVVVARFPAALSPAGALLLFAGSVALFTLFGAYLLRRRLVVPLQTLAGAARMISQGQSEVRVSVDGVAETSDVATAFNEMTEALEGRAEALEKAVAELRESNQKLRQARVGLDRAERLAAVGRLAAGVAHEVGNPMGALLAFLELGQRDPGLSDTSRESLRKAGREGERVRVILRQLLDFSRPASATRAAVDLAAIAQEAVDLLGAQTRFSPVEMTVESEGSPPRALADTGVVVQIVLNLLLNAASAVAAADAPRIEITVRPAADRVRPGEDADAVLEQRAVFDAVECVVDDNGPGVPTEDRERIFDPFYTTQPPGEGTGLGLANSVRFAEELGGQLEVGDAPGGGARFILRLPAYRDAEASNGRVRR